MSKITDAASAKNYDRLSDLWLVGLPGELPPEDMITVFRMLHRDGQPQLAQELLDLAMEEMSTEGGRPFVQLLKGAAGIFGRGETLRTALIEAVRDEHLMFKPLEHFLRLSGLMSKNADVGVSWRRFEDLMKYSEGGFLYHHTFGPGRITRSNRTSLTINFEKDSDHDMKLDVALESTVPLEADSLIVMRWLHPEVFQRLFGEEPSTFLEKIVAEPFGKPGEIQPGDLTPVLEGSDISVAEAWKSLRRSAADTKGFADLGDRIILQDKSTDMVSQIREILNARKTSVSLKTREIQALINSSGGLDTDSSVELLAELGDLVSPETGALFELCWTLTEKGRMEQFPVMALPLVESTSARCGRAVGEIHSLSCRKRYLEMFLSGDSAIEEKLHLLTQLKRPMWEHSASFLVEEDPSLLLQCLQLFLSDQTSTDRFLWALCFVAEKGGEGYSLPDGDPMKLFMKNLPFTCADTQKKVAGLLTGRLKEELSHYLESLDTRGLTDHLNSLDSSSTAHREGLYLAVGREVSRRKFSDSCRPEISFFWESDKLYSSGEAIGRRREECLRLKQVEIPAAAEAVGVAASHGDLSENAEYSAAIERRDLLLDRLRRWTEELERYIPYPSAEISSDLVSPGTRIELVRGETAVERREIEIVGPLDADPDLNRINYMAPVANSLLGRAPGDQVTLQGNSGEEWEILSIQVLKELVKT